MSQNHSTNQHENTKYVGLILALLSLISIFAMLHHPSVAATDTQAQIREINQESALNAFVHGGLIALTILISVCLTVYGQLRGLNRVSILLGVLCYWLGTFAMINAALISGFVVPKLAEAYSQASVSQLVLFEGLTKLNGLTNQSFANFGALCWCAAMCSWAFDMLKRDGPIKLFAVVSAVVAIIIAISLMTEWLVLHVFGMTLVLIAVSAWHIGIAWLLYSAR